MVHAKGVFINIKHRSFDKDLLVRNGLVTVALLEDVRGGKTLGGERVLGDFEDACSRGCLGFNRTGEDQEGGEEGDEVV